MVGRYRLDALLGTGGMASVWRARDERLGRDVAVKVLSETLALDRDFVKRFGREARIAARLSHPNLVQVFDFEAGGQRPFLVSEYVSGGTLADRLAAGQPIDAGGLARQLLGALEHIHSAGVIHRDVKPANVLIDEQGRALLTDFGIAQPSSGGTRITETGKVLGTRGYMAPEVEAGEPATKRSDLYSVGVVLGETLGAESPPELSTLAERLTAEDPKARPRSTRAALGMLESDPEAPTQAIAPTKVPRTAVMPRRGRPTPLARTARLPSRKRMAALAAAVAFGLAGFAIAQGLGGEGPPSPRAAALGTLGEKQPTATEAPTTTAAPPPTTTAAATAPAAATPATLSDASQICAAAGQFEKKELETMLEENFGLDKHAAKDALKQCEEDGETEKGGGGGPPPWARSKGHGGEDD